MSNLTVLYIRVSTEAQADEGYSIDAQTEKLTAYCRMKGIEHFEPIIDGGYSGSNLDRPGIQRLIALSRAREAVRVVVYKLDRLSRSQKDTLYLIEDVFLPNAVDFVSINENIDTGSPYGRAMIGILSAFAQLERENIFLRTRMGMAQRVKNGYWPGGGKIPFGYDYDTAQGILMPNADAQKVDEIFRLYRAGWSAAKLAELFDFSHEQSVSQLLTHQLYTGVIAYKGETYAGRHEPLISRELFDDVQQCMERRSRTPRGSAGYLLTGLLICGHCGAKMRYQRWGKAGMKLVCYSRDRTKTHLVRDRSCANDGVMAEKIEAIIVKDLKRLSVELPEQSALQGNTTQLIKKRQEQLERRLSRLYTLYADAEDETLKDTIERIRGEIRKLKEQAQMEESRFKQFDKKREQGERLRKIGQDWANLTNDEQRELVRACVEKVVIKNDSVRIYYTFETNEEQKAAVV